MDTPKFRDMNDDQLRRSFLILGCTFFQLKSNITSTNILRHLSDRTGEAGAMIESLRKTVEQASDSSTKVAGALNKVTLALVIVAFLTLIMQGASLWAHFHLVATPTGASPLPIP
jgi:hypothetical protein